MEISEQLAKQIQDEAIAEMTRMRIPINKDTLQLMTLQIQDLMRKRPDVVKLMVNPPATDIEHTGLGGLGLTKAQRKKHVAKINTAMALKNSGAITQAQYNARIGKIQKQKKADNKAGNQKALITGIVAVAAVVTGTVLLAPVLGIGTAGATATGGTSLLTSGTGIATALIGASKASGQSPLALVSNFIPKASEGIQSITGQTPSGLMNLANQMLDNSINRVTTPPVQLPSALPPSALPPSEKREPSAEAKKEFPTALVIGGGALVLLLGIMLLKGKKK